MGTHQVRWMALDHKYGSWFDYMEPHVKPTAHSPAPFPSFYSRVSFSHFLSRPLRRLPYRTILPAYHTYMGIYTHIRATVATIYPHTPPSRHSLLRVLS